MVGGAEECLAEYLKYRPEAAEEWKTQRKLAFDRRITTLGAFLRKN
jgi:lipopolysaccharide/colanic/teichoic acid biosynthesis glycosyltransferase